MRCFSAFKAVFGPLLAGSLLFIILNNKKATLGQPSKDKIHVGSVFSRDFVKGQLFALSEIKSSLLGNLSLLLQICLVTYNHLNDVFFEKVAYVLQLVLHLQKSIFPCNIVNNYGCSCASIKSLHHRPK